MVATLALALLAGIVSTLSPCVLPILPIVLGAAASAHRLGPAALAGGLAVSFTAIGLFVATIGFALGLDAGVVRGLAGALFIAFGIFLLVPQLQTALALASAPIGNWTQRRYRPRGSGFGGQFTIGLLLGAVWAPCVGPTLGAASVLAAQGEKLGEVAATMLVFGLGAALPLLALGMVSRSAMTGMRSRLLVTGQLGKAIAGGLLIAFGTMIVLGIDKRVEAILVAASPNWLTELTTAF